MKNGTEVPDDYELNSDKVNKINAALWVTVKICKSTSNLNMETSLTQTRKPWDKIIFGFKDI